MSEQSEQPTKQEQLKQHAAQAAKKAKEVAKETPSNIRYWIRQKLPYLILLVLLSLLVGAYFWRYVFITIHSGEAGVLYKRLTVGTITDYVYPEGFYVIPPWDTMYIYNARIQTILHEFDVLTNLGLPIHLSLAIRFRPEYEMIGVLHQQVGPDYVNTIIIPEVESVLRKQIGHYKPEDIYINKENILTEIIITALDELGQKFVKINDVIIRAVILPDEVANAIEMKLVEEQREQTYAFIIKREREEAKRKRIEAGGIRDYQAIIGETLDNKLLTWQGIQATLNLAASPNSKVVVVGSGKEGLPIILGLGNDQTSGTTNVPTSSDSTADTVDNTEFQSSPTPAVTTGSTPSATPPTPSVPPTVSSMVMSIMSGATTPNLPPTSVLPSPTLPQSSTTN